MGQGNTPQINHEASYMEPLQELCSEQTYTGVHGRGRLVDEQGMVQMHLPGRRWERRQA